MQKGLQYRVLCMHVGSSALSREKKADTGLKEKVS